MPIDRRTLFQTSLAGVAAAVAPAHGVERAHRVVDTNVSLFQWPFRRLALDEPDRLAEKLRSLEIDEAWAGSFEALLHRDFGEVNARLAEACERHERLIPVGCVNPAFPDWEEDLRRCQEVHKMPGIRLHPNYHGYGLDDPRCEQLLALAAERGLLVQVAATMEDGRTQHPLVHLADVDLTPLAKLKSGRVQILNWRPRGPLLEKLVTTPGVFFDTARVEATDGIAKLIRAIPEGRVWFGSHAPFQIYESALIKVYESDLTESELQALFQSNDV